MFNVFAMSCHRAKNICLKNLRSCQVMFWAEMSHKWHCHVKRFMSTFSVIDFRMCPFRNWYCCAHVSVRENMQKIVWVGGSFCLNEAGKLNHTIPFRNWYCCAHVSVRENMQKIVWVGGSFCLNGAGKLNHTKRQKRFFWKVHGEMEGCSVKEIQVSAIRLEMKHYSK